MKNRKLLIIILYVLLVSIGFIGFGWFAVSYGGWFIPTFEVNLLAVLIALPASAFITYCKIPKIGGIVFYPVSNQFIAKLGITFPLAFFFWLLLGQSIPAAITNIFSETKKTQDVVVDFSRSTTTCGQRLVLLKANPPFGGYCRAGAPNRFQANQQVNVTYKESIFGLSILAIKPAS